MRAAPCWDPWVWEDSIAATRGALSICVRRRGSRTHRPSFKGLRVRSSIARRPPCCSYHVLRGRRWCRRDVDRAARAGQMVAVPSRRTCCAHHGRICERGVWRSVQVPDASHRSSPARPVAGLQAHPQERGLSANEGYRGLQAGRYVRAKRWQTLILT